MIYLNNEFSVLYDQIANNKMNSLTRQQDNHQSKSPVEHRDNRAPHLSSHQRSKSEHHPKYFGSTFGQSSGQPSDQLSSFRIIKSSDPKVKRATVQIPLNHDLNDEEYQLTDVRSKPDVIVMTTDHRISADARSASRTPEHEPPSPSTAENGIKAVINPLSQVSVSFSPFSYSILKNQF